MGACLSEYRYNHVDRVRLGKSSNYNRDCPNRGSGWRQRSASHSDLIAPSKSSSNQNKYRHLRTSRSLDWNNNVDFQEFCSRVEPEKDYDDYYYENYENKDQRYDPHQQPANESCSLRRTRSLAVIREETFNDLQISSINTRRSQLIPRAKLVNRSFFRQRYHQKHRRDEDSVGSGVETQTSETRESDDYYANLKRLDSVNIVPPSWQNDKSDLESLNSDYFKNSAHQGNQHDKQKQRQYQQQKISKNSRSGNRFQVLEIEVHQDNSQSSAFPETTPSNTDHSDSSSSDRDREEGILEEVINSEKFEEIHLKEVVQVSEEQISSRTLTLKKDKQKDDDIQRPFIAYDSVYLSSEESSVESTIIEENYEEKFENVILSSNHDSENTSLLQISIEDEYDQQVDINEEEYKDCERVYTPVTKSETIPSSKPKILSVERKLKTLSDYATTTKRGVLEHLTYISTSQLLKTNDVQVIDSFRPNLIENQYYSLPDINIGRRLKVSERIDARLRSTYNVSHVEGASEDANRGSDQSAIYNSINSFGRAHKRARQREFGEIDSLIKVDSPISDDEAKSIELEQPKEAPSIEVEPEAICKEDGNVNESRLLKDFYVEDTPTEGKVITSSDLISIEADSDGEDDRETPFEKQKANNSEARFQINQTTNNFPGQFRIIVTDAQNNVIEEDSIESTAPSEDDIQVEVKSPRASCTPLSLEKETGKNPANSVVTDTWKDKNKDSPDSESLRVINSTKETEQINKIRPQSPIPLPKDNINNNKEILDTTSIFRARPVKIYSNDVLRISETKMSRPQILHVIDSKKCDPPRQDNDKKSQPSQVEEEFLNRVDSVRCYWSKLIQDEKDSSTTEKNERNFVTSIEDEKFIPNSQIHLPLLETAGQNHNNLQSFSPTVEIVELNGEKQATIVKAHDAHDAEEPEFDHVRYKIMKSNLFRKNILTRNKKEAQFDGLLQYLQDYSFQELLSNNNVVIIEPVRTKIEKPSQGQTKPHTNNCKITGGSGADVKSSNTKRHFFYHPVRVNRELLEDELPSPDTVRNVRRFFEENVLRKQSNGGLSKPQKSTEPSASNHKRRNLRYLTIDTSYGGLRKWDSASLSSGISSGDLSSPCDCSNEGDPQNQGRCPSKGVNGQHEEIYTSEENLCDDDICESYYVSEDVLEKIRECGSTVTYYGGQVVNNKSPELNPVTKAIIQEIRDEETRKCTACQPNSCPQSEDLQHQIMDKGLKFKLVKSNSCSSRLELVGTEKDLDSKTTSQGMSTKHSPEPEETVRELVHRLESGAINSNPVPRIIESQCIEKTIRSGSLTSSYEGNKGKLQDSVTINNHLIGSKDPLGLVDIIKQVTVNNHISFCPPLSNVKTSTTEGINFSEANADVKRDDEGQLSPTAAIISQKTNKKLCRNKNVDLAFTMTKTGPGTIKSLCSEKQDGSSSSTSKHSSLSLDTDKLSTKNKSQGDDFGILRKNSGPLTETAVKGAAADTVSNTTNVKTDGRKDDIILYNGFHEHRINSNKIENGISDAEIGKSKLTTIFHSENNEKKKNLSAIEKNPPRENSEGSVGNEEERKMNLRPSFKQEGQPQPSPQADKSFVKHYVANDRKLVEIRKYDDIEFEEFEVYDPTSGTKETRNDPTSDAKETIRNENPEECYDSLDDKL